MADRSGSGPGTDASGTGPPRWERGLLHALFTQAAFGVAALDTDLTVVRSNLPHWLAAHAPAATALPDRPRRLADVLAAHDADTVTGRIRHVIDSGEPLTGWVLTLRPAACDRELVLSLSAVRTEDDDGRASGALLTLADLTGQYAAQRRIELVDQAARGIGQSLDVTRCAEELARAFVPAVADLAAVDLTEAVVRGEEPDAFLAGGPLRRAAVAPADAPWPSEVYPVDAEIRLRTEESAFLRNGEARFLNDLEGLRGLVAGQPDRERLLLPARATSFLLLPLLARGLVLGCVGLWRTGERPGFVQEDAAAAEEVATSAALGIDNARRYTRELHIVQNLQQSLLPRPELHLGAALTVGSYVPAASAERISGVWYDAIPLSSARLALVIGDARGHGPEATATMARLRTAVRTLADLDLPPEDLLTHLDDLVTHLAATDRPGRRPGVAATDGPTCLYAVYDPVDGSCELAGAGHRLPLIVDPETGPLPPPAAEPGPPLGVGSAPFGSIRVDVRPGSVLALCTEGLVRRAGGSEEAAVARIAEQVHRAAADAGPIGGLGHRVLAGVLTEPPGSDLALLLARVRTLPAGAVARWEFPADPAAVGAARAAAVDRLAAWGLAELALTTELIVSELVTNAVRYAGGPVVLRLIRDERLTCEVADPGPDRPRLRRARPTDEGGRGLFLVARLSDRWGSRRTPTGKVVWTEQLLPSGPAGGPGAPDRAG
ncbi:SpoIIE family protein phosphatase [Kitasatospora paranensis]|uniref:SpoIIE family protein phosphatase n=1 Tax=Kitasatospora paranensis TaxID=258053 RepID=A0ABW2G7N2_9ACTN